MLHIIFDRNDSCTYWKWMFLSVHLPRPAVLSMHPDSCRFIKRVQQIRLHLFQHQWCGCMSAIDRRYTRSNVTCISCFLSRVTVLYNENINWYFLMRPSWKSHAIELRSFLWRNARWRMWASTLAPLQRVLHAAARLVMNLGPRDPVTPALRELHWLPIQSRIQFKLCLLVHHAIGGRSPGYISELVIPVADIPGRSTLRSAERHDLFVPRSKLVSSERAFSVAAPKAWNRLPVDIRLTPDTRLFKKQLKTFLFSSAYPASP